MIKRITIMLILFICLGCTNINIESDPVDEEKEPIEEVYDEPPYSTLDEYKHVDYFCPEFLTFDSSLFHDHDRLAIIIRTDNDSHGKSLIIGIYETEGILYVGDYEIIENGLFEGNLYSFSVDFTDVMDYYYTELTFPLETKDIDGYFVLSDDFKTLYFLTDEEQLATGDYSDAQVCTILYYQ